MNIALMQTDIVWGSPGENIQRVDMLMEKTPAADLYVLPEMWATGFAIEPELVAEDEAMASSLAWMRRKAAERDCAISGSLAVRLEDGSYRNRHYFVTPTTVDYYDKRHLFTHGHEDRHYQPGLQQVVVRWRGVRFLLLTCYDLRFPVWSRWGRAGEYDAILLVANWPQKRQQAWSVLVRARAIENQCFVLAVNRIGTDANQIVYGGGSMVAEPTGHVVIEDTQHNEQVLSAELDMERLMKMRSHFRVLDDRD